MSVSKVWGVLVVAALAACTERVNVCERDADCSNPAFPFCDVNGEFAESGFTERSCSIIPESCPIERCGCTPGASRCDGETLRVCNPDGMSEQEEICALGCEPTEMRCLTFDPSHGLGAHFESAASLPAAVLPDGARINTTTGAIVDATDLPIPVQSIVITQLAGPSIRVFLASSWTMGAATVSGDHAFAVVSDGDVVINGVLDASATRTNSGPGALQTGACVGGALSSGGGGAGNATAGAIGGDDEQGNFGTAGAQLLPSGSLTGGCRGGSDLDGNGAVSGQGGGGGGAVQLASRRSVVIAATGLIDVGAGGGDPDAGGGSGGNVLLEAPRVTLHGGVVTNGGAGGGCSVAGSDGLRDTAPALGTRCGQVNRYGGGAGGSILAAPTRGGRANVMFTAEPGGGGGAMGHLAVASESGAHEGGATISAATTQTAINPR